jgi:hypothetical protein
MDIASVFAWFAKESMRAADLAHDPRLREIWTRLAVLWGLAETHCRHGGVGKDAVSTSATTGLKPPRGRRPLRKLSLLGANLTGMPAARRHAAASTRAEPRTTPTRRGCGAGNGIF